MLVLPLVNHQEFGHQTHHPSDINTNTAGDGHHLETKVSDYPPDLFSLALRIGYRGRSCLILWMQRVLTPFLILKHLKLKLGRGFPSSKHQSIKKGYGIRLTVRLGFALRGRTRTYIYVLYIESSSEPHIVLSILIDILASSDTHLLP
jgi:hypothetical protein